MLEISHYQEFDERGVERERMEEERFGWKFNFKGGKEKEEEVVRWERWRRVRRGDIFYGVRRELRWVDGGCERFFCLGKVVCLFEV